MHTYGKSTWRVSVLLIFVFLFHPILLMGHSVQAEGNMLAQQSVYPLNGGFETTVNGKPKDWIAYSTTQIHETSTEQVSSGTYSVKLTNPTLSAGLRSAKIPVTPGTLYEASVMSFNVDKASELYLEFWDSANKRITPVSIKGNTTQNKWTEIYVRQQAPAQAVSATLLLYLNSGNKGTTYFDHATFGIASPQQSNFDQLVINTSKTLYQVGDIGTVRWYGTNSDGS
ncbi:MAG: hypothetical protein K0R28_6402, partial [Paenibacillus sp.]|nr:hypothetical protein [Paenibacillus sp.]